MQARPTATGAMMGDTERDNRRRTALVTGAGKTGQVGEAVARAFARAGWHVLLVARSREEAEARAADIRADGGSCAAYAADLADAAATTRLAQVIRDEQGAHLDAVVHLAGGWIGGAPVGESAPADWERAISINLLTAAYTARAFVPHVRLARGAFVFFASEAVLPGSRVGGMAAYAAAKAGVAAMARALAQEERAHGVRANVLAPGAMRTATNLADMGEVAYVEREEVADAVLWLCSPAASAISGEVIRLSAGGRPRDHAAPGEGG